MREILVRVLSLLLVVFFQIVIGYTQKVHGLEELWNGFGQKLFPFVLNGLLFTGITNKVANATIVVNDIDALQIVERTHGRVGIYLHGGCYIPNGGDALIGLPFIRQDILADNIGDLQINRLLLIKLHGYTSLSLSLK